MRNISEIRSEYHAVMNSLEAANLRLQNANMEQSNLRSRNANLQEIRDIEHKVRNIESQISNLQRQANDITNENSDIIRENNQIRNENMGYERDIGRIEEEILRQDSEYDEYMSLFDNMSVAIDEYGGFANQRIDPDLMRVIAVPASNIGDTNIARNAVTARSLDMLNLYLEKMDFIDMRHEDGQTVLTICLKNSFWPGVEACLRAGANVGISDDHGYTPLMYFAIMPNSRYGDLMLEHATSEDVNYQHPDSGLSVLHHLFDKVGKDVIFYDNEVNYLQSHPENPCPNSFYFDSNVTLTSGGGNGGDAAFVINGNMVVGSKGPGGFTVEQFRALLIARQMAEKGVNFDLYNNQGESTLYHITMTKQQYLLDNIRDEFNFSFNNLSNKNEAVILSYFNGDKNLLNHALGNNEINSLKGTLKGNNLAHLAVLKQENDMLAKLLEKGVNPLTENIDKNTALSICILNFYIKNNQLNNQNTKPNIIPKIEEEMEIYKKLATTIIEKTQHQIDASTLFKGYNMLLWVLELNDANILKLFIDNHKVDTKTINDYDPNGKNAFTYVIEKSNIESLKLLLNIEGSNPNLPNPQGAYPITLAIGKGDEYVDVFLAANSVNPNVMSKFTLTINNQKLNFTAPSIWYLVQKNDANNLTKFLDHEATDKELARSDNQNTALHLAAYKKDVDLIHLLLEKNCNINSQNIAGMTGFYIVCSLKSLECAKEFLKYKGDMDLSLKSQDGNGIMSWAAELKNLEILDEILKLDSALINSYDNEGRTLLHWMAIYKWIDFFKYLIEKNADPTYQEYQNNKTAIMMLVEDMQIDKEEKILILDMCNVRNNIDYNMIDKNGKSLRSYIADKLPDYNLNINTEEQMIEINNNNHQMPNESGGINNDLENSFDELIGDNVNNDYLLY